MWQASEQRQPGWLFAASMLSFLSGIIIYVFRITWWIVGVGTLLFILLLALAIFLAGSENELIQKIGGFGVPFAIFFFFIWIFWFYMWAPKWKKNRLLKSGIEAPGIILDFQQTGTSIEEGGNLPKYLTLIFVQVKPSRAPIFESTAKEMLNESEIIRLSKGMPVQVKYTPDNLKNIVIISWKK